MLRMIGVKRTYSHLDEKQANMPLSSCRDAIFLAVFPIIFTQILHTASRSIYRQSQLIIHHVKSTKLFLIRMCRRLLLNFLPDQNDFIIPRLHGLSPRNRLFFEFLSMFHLLNDSISDFLPLAFAVNRVLQ